MDRLKLGSIKKSRLDSLPAEKGGYVGRGGVKLEKALHAFSVQVEKKVCLDVGASTGGFTDCLLRHGAEKVYAVDVGRGQLAWKLRQDSRVIVLEKQNARYLTRREIPEPIDLCTMDVSFISVTKILPGVKALLSPEGEIIVLIKPQFEVGPKHVKKGIVRERKVHEKILNDFLEWFPAHHFFPKNCTYSPISGRDGNLEFFFHLATSGPLSPIAVEPIVEEAHRTLGISSS